MDRAGAGRQRYINRHITGAIVRRQSSAAGRTRCSARAQGRRPQLRRPVQGLRRPGRTGQLATPAGLDAAQRAGAAGRQRRRAAWLLAPPGPTPATGRVSSASSTTRVRCGSSRTSSATGRAAGGGASRTGRPAGPRRPVAAGRRTGRHRGGTKRGPRVRWRCRPADTGELDQLRRQLESIWRVESSAELAGRLTDERVRVVGDPAELIKVFGATKETLLTGEVLATGRRELLPFLREQAVSKTLHRFGHVPPER